MLNRFLGTAAIIFVGLNVIWLGCIESNANNRWNPIWGLVDGFVTLEKMALLAAVAIGAVFLIVMAMPYVIDFFTPKEKRQEMKSYSNRSHDYEYERDTSPRTNRNGDVPKPVNTSSSITESKSIARENLVQEQPREIPKKPKPTPEELKEKAIQDLLRG